MNDPSIVYHWYMADVLPSSVRDGSQLTMEVWYEHVPADPGVGLGEDATVTEAYCHRAVFAAEEGEPETWEPEGLSGDVLGRLLGEMLVGQVNCFGDASEEVRRRCLEDWRERD